MRPWLNVCSPFSEKRSCLLVTIVIHSTLGNKKKRKKGNRCYVVRISNCRFLKEIKMYKSAVSIMSQYLYLLICFVFIPIHNNVCAQKMDSKENESKYDYHWVVRYARSIHTVCFQIASIMTLYYF